MTNITDLPGIYSFSPYTSEELVSRDFVIDEHPRGIINIVDATNIERNLYLTMQCLEMGVPMVVALNMMDELTGNGGSVDINRILTGKWTAIPCFIAIMLTVFFLTFNVIGGWLQEKLDVLIDMGAMAADEALTKAGINEAIHGLIIDGVFAGVGSVLSFLPIILVMFLFLSLLEDSGYLARVAFFMDKPLRRIGLSGRSIVPMLVGFGCTVPAVMSTRTLPSDRDRRMTILRI